MFVVFIEVIGELVGVGFGGGGRERERNHQSDCWVVSARHIYLI